MGRKDNNGASLKRHKTTGVSDASLECGKCITAFGYTGRNSLSDELWLGGDNHLGRLNTWGGAAWLSGLVAALALLPEQVLPQLPLVLRVA